jgi:hypothetical protein
MAVMKFDLDNRLDAIGDTSHELIAIESAECCDGEECGLRPELYLPEKELADHIALHGDRPPISHYHMVASRRHQGARRYSVPI